MRDADNSAILAYLRLRPTEAVATAGEVGSGGAGGTGGTGEDTYRVNRHLRPREEWAATTTVEYTITVTNPDRAERYAPDIHSPDPRLRREANKERFARRGRALDTSPAAVAFRAAQRAAFDQYDTNHSGERDH